MLKLADNLSVPLDIVTQTATILAKRRAGKSYTARRIVEELFRADQQVVIIDPKGDWWGIRSSADGKSPGLPVVILGGEHGDAPLEASSGEVVAKLIVEERVSALLDVSFFRKYEVAQFMAIFLETLYRLKAKEQYRTPVMLVIDEADAIASQKPQKGEERMLGAAEDIVRRGGQRGIGCLMVTQRSAVLNKNVLTQSQVIVALRTIAPQDIAALDAWIDVHGTQEERKTLLDSIASLPIGDAWFWSPGWPSDKGIFKRVHVLPIATFDSGATPKPGERRIQPKHLADVDLEALKRQMAATIEKAKADDPKELKKKIADLENQIPKDAAKDLEQWKVAIKQLKDQNSELQKGMAKYERAMGALMKFVVKVESENVIVDTKAVADLVQRSVVGAIEKVNLDIERKVKSLKHEAGALKKMLDDLNGDGKIDIKVSLDDKPRTFMLNEQHETHVPKHPIPAHSAPQSNGLGKGEMKILSAIIQHGAVERDQLTVLTGYRRSSRDTYLQRLGQAGMILINGGTIEPTHHACSKYPNIEPLPTGRELIEHWQSNLPVGEKAIFDILVQTYPRAMERNDLDNATGYKRSSRDTYLQRLIQRRLVEVAGPGAVKASKVLFEEM